jgi:hypothetical protein
MHGVRPIFSSVMDEDRETHEATAQSMMNSKQKALETGDSGGAVLKIRYLYI